jgi:hypothetical protein
MPADRVEIIIASRMIWTDSAARFPIFKPDDFCTAN